jgi:uncharacterized cupin superfamily protein
MPAVYDKQSMAPLILQNRHTGERLELRRVAKNGEIWLAIYGLLPPRRQGPPLHVHYGQVEEARVRAGTLSTLLNGKQGRVNVGETNVFPAGAAHRWWNDGDDTLVVEGYAKPASDLDRYLYSVLEVLNSGTADRPPLFYMAHVAWRHRRTQRVVLMPRPIEAVVLPLIVLVGTLLGRYRGTEWPGCPSRSQEAPLLSGDEVHSQADRR